MTHTDLVKAAALWISNRASIVITEMATVGEEPDVLGFNSGDTILIECKATRADFLCDRKKFYRQNPEHGVGSERYYFCPNGLIEAIELPEKWGLVEWDGSKARIKKKAEPQIRNYAMEQRILVSSIRRIGAHFGQMSAINGVSVKAYTYETKNRATLGIGLD